jgi:hypothetical protein
LVDAIRELQEFLRSGAAAIESHPLPGEPPGSIERFVLEHGRPYLSQKLTDQEQAIVEAAVAAFRWANKTFEHRCCFANSQGLLACDRARRIVYVEGFEDVRAVDCNGARASEGVVPFAIQVRVR